MEAFKAAWGDVPEQTMPGSWGATSDKPVPKPRLAEAA